MPKISQSLSNDDRDIIKLGIFGCCGREWEVEVTKTYQRNKAVYKPTKTVCHRCDKNVGPRKIVDLEERWFGHFKCLAYRSGGLCGRFWLSSWTWTVNNQIQTTKCKDCGANTLPFQIVSFQNGCVEGKI